MTPSIENLLKFLRLEAERGCDNRAVVGGLEKMLGPWQEQAHADKVPTELVEMVAARLRDYHRLSPNSRYEVLKGIWSRVQTEYPQDSIPDLPAFSAEDDELQKVQEEPSEYEPPKPSPPTVPVTPEPEPVEPQAAPSPPEEELPQAALGAPLTTIQGIGPKSAKTLSKLGLNTLGDLLWYLPRRYDDYSRLETINRLWFGQEVTIIGTVETIEQRTVRSGKMKLIEAVISDGTGSIRVTWFNQPWIADRLKSGRPIVLSGKVDQYLGKLTMNNPDWEAIDRQQLHTNRIVPVYPLTSGITNKWLRRIIHNVVMRYAPGVDDPLPPAIRDGENLPTRSFAIQQVHFPDSWKDLENSQNRLAFDEMFLLQLGVLRQKMDWEAIQGEPLTIPDERMDAFTSSLPFELTQSQQKAIAAVRSDLGRSQPMNRLLQGDVGSGKTAVAAAGIIIAAHNNAQSAVMAPTSILADQHYQTLLKMLPTTGDITPDSIRILIGATPNSEREEILKGLSDGSIKVIIGTHALLEDPVDFKRIGLLVIDEQHRFGVEQRARLRAKGDNPNLLVMTATPIPRSLALTIYGDLDLTVLDEIPPGRHPVETRVLTPLERGRAHTFIHSQLDAGRQAFIIYPLVEGSEKVQAKAAVDEHARLQEEAFQDYRVGLLHGRLSQDEKESVMEAFRQGELDVLVSTSVVEVGVDVPNATVMLVEGANHFGLAQLHQFRGRVGRGEHASYCLLIPDTDEDLTNARLKAMEATNDGFELAELDLEHRGPGQFLGTRQSGFAELQTAQLTDVRLIERARNRAGELFAADPDLSQEGHSLLAAEMQRFWTEEKGEIS